MIFSSEITLWLSSGITVSLTATDHGVGTIRCDVRLPAPGRQELGDTLVTLFAEVADCRVDLIERGDPWTMRVGRAAVDFDSVAQAQMVKRWLSDYAEALPQLRAQQPQARAA